MIIEELIVVKDRFGTERPIPGLEQEDGTDKDEETPTGTLSGNKSNGIADWSEVGRLYSQLSNSAPL